MGGTLQATLLYLVLYLVLLHICRCSNIAVSQDEEWKTATATYSKETDGSIITGTLLASGAKKLQTFQVFDCINVMLLHILQFFKVFFCFFVCLCCRRCLWLWGPSQDQLWETQCWAEWHFIQQREYMWGLLSAKMC